jgi:hypothetical protein
VDDTSAGDSSDVLYDTLYHYYCKEYHDTLLFRVIR